MARDRKIKSKKVVLASDHAGFKLKEEIKKFLIKNKKKVLDLGTKGANSVDYPDYAHLLAKKMRKESLKAMMILQVHDELIFEVPKEEIEQVKSMVIREMESALPLSVPIVVDWGVGDSWYEAH